MSTLLNIPYRSSTNSRFGRSAESRGSRRRARIIDPPSIWANGESLRESWGLAINSVPG